MRNTCAFITVKIPKSVVIIKLKSENEIQTSQTWKREQSNLDVRHNSYLIRLQTSAEVVY